MIVDYIALRWDEGNIYEHNRLCREYIGSGRSYIYHTKYSKNVPITITLKHENAARQLSRFLDRMGVKHLTRNYLIHANRQDL